MKSLKTPIVSLSILAVFLLSSCSREIEGTFSGTLRWGFETQNIYVDGEDEVWWVSPREGTFEELGKDYGLRLNQLDEEHAVVLQYRVKLKGVASKKGKYGHFGIFERQLAVEEVVDFKWIGKNEQ